MRASAFNQEVARLLGVRVGRMLTLGWALASLVGSLAGLLIAGGSLVHPGYMDSVVVYGFVAAVLGGLDSPAGAVVGGLLLGLVAEPGVRVRRVAAGRARGAGDPDAVLLLRPQGLFSQARGAAGLMSRAPCAASSRPSSWPPLGLVVVIVLVLDDASTTSARSS